MNDKPILYGFGASTYTQTAMLALEEKGVGYQLIAPDSESQWQQLHPFRRVPILRHGALVLRETLTIVCYINDRFPGDSLQPEGAAKYENLTWVSYYLDYFDKAILNGSVRPRFVLPQFGIEVDEEAIKENIPSMAVCMSVLSLQLKSHNFILGERLGLADLFYFPTLLYFEATPEGESLLAEAAPVRQWMERMRDRASVRKVCGNSSTSQSNGFG